MVSGGTRYVQLLPLLFAVCHLTLALPTQNPYTQDDTQKLQVSMLHPKSLSASLGGSVVIPCLVSLSPTSASTLPPLLPRVKWSVVSNGVETEILVVLGERVKISESYRERAVLFNYTSSSEDLSLRLGMLRASDSGHYRCEVQQGLEDASDLVELKVKGVVFHYRDASGRYAFSFDSARKACEDIEAHIATPHQLLAAYYDGYEQCDAGWLADQSVRYPIQVPRQGCFGDMDSRPGVRNYGTMDSEDLFDVYCYVGKIDGEVFHDPIPQQLSLDEARSYCKSAGARLATTGQLHLAWSEGLDRCSPGWLSDGSVRYPIVTPRERCGGPQAGVKTLYRFSNQTGFLEPSSLHDVYCFKDYKNSPTDSPMDYMATESEDIGQDIVILMEPVEELQLSQNSEQVEREAQSVLESLPIFPRPSIREDLVETPPTIMPSTTDIPFNFTSSSDLPKPFDEMSSLIEMEYDSQHPTELLPSATNETDTNSTLYSTPLLPIKVLTDSPHVENISLHQPEFENTPEFPEPSYEPHRHYQPMPDTNLEEHESQLSDGSRHYQPMPETNLDWDRSEANYSKAENNQSKTENMTKTTPMTPDSLFQSKLEESVVQETNQTALSTQSPAEVEELVTQQAQATLFPQKELTSMWLSLEGSGDISQESDLSVGMGSSPAPTESSTSDFTSQPSPSVVSTTIPFEVQTGFPDPSISASPKHSEELGRDAYSTPGPLWESIPRQEGSTSLEFDDTTSMEKVYSSVETQQPQVKSEELLDFGTSLATTAAPELSNSSQLPTNSSTTEYQTSSHILHVDPTTATNEEGSGQESTTVAPTLEEEITVFPFNSQTSDWALLSTTYAPQESLDDLEYSRQPSSISPVVTPDSSPESDLSSTKPTTATMMTTTQWSKHTWSPTTTTPKPFHDSAELQMVTAHIPPVDQGRVDHEFSLTQPPTLLILPNERAAVGGTGKLSDACLEDPCLNGGTCVEYNEGVKCLCLPSYGGEFCQTDLEECEPGWDKFQGFCYRHFSQRLSWEVAEQHCRMVGAHLVSIMTPEEQSYINSNYKEYQWTGLNDKTIEDDFRWSDGNPLLYENWYRGQPDSYFLSGEDCVVMVWHDAGRWSDVPCNYHLAYTCKKGTSTCGPPPRVQNASIFGKVRQRYTTDAVVRYHCSEGFRQRRTPLVRCLPGGNWEKPQIQCIPEAGVSTSAPGATSSTAGSFGGVEDEFETTKQPPQYWDIKF
ncbi:brevican core protein-like [Lampris incognitus]|uniref:brevican core protein-like n=1 Tax=Lampris incognitus TaxID=2546036 RepID=UPI0024B606E4|nr:brevican core protein-like [Lampris incognitus]